jgi:hypothetical protein
MRVYYTGGARLRPSGEGSADQLPILATFGPSAPVEHDPAPRSAPRLQYPPRRPKTATAAIAIDLIVRFLRLSYLCSPLAVRPAPRPAIGPSDCRPVNIGNQWTPAPATVCRQASRNRPSRGRGWNERRIGNDDGGVRTLRISGSSPFKPQLASDLAMCQMYGGPPRILLRFTHAHAGSPAYIGRRRFDRYDALSGCRCRSSRRAWLCDRGQWPPSREGPW